MAEREDGTRVLSPVCGVCNRTNARAYCASCVAFSVQLHRVRMAELHGTVARLRAQVQQQLQAWNRRASEQGGDGADVGSGGGAGTGGVTLEELRADVAAARAVVDTLASVEHRGKRLMQASKRLIRDRCEVVMGILRGLQARRAQGMADGSLHPGALERLQTLAAEKREVHGHRVRARARLLLFVTCMDWAGMHGSEAHVRGEARRYAAGHGWAGEPLAPWVRELRPWYGRCAWAVWCSSLACRGNNHCVEQRSRLRRPAWSSQTLR